MTSYDSAPFAAPDDDRAPIWNMLVKRDIDAYLTQDWGAVASDFLVDGFHGLDAGGKSNPDEWRLAFADLSAYRNEWLRQAQETARTADQPRARAALFSATTLEDIETSRSRAIWP